MFRDNNLRPAGFENKPLERAHAVIEKGTVQLGNAWLERRWNAFLGSTVELLRLPGRIDSLVRRSPEFHLDYGSRPIAAPDLGDIGWSEAVDSHGAAVTLELAGPGVAIRIESFVFHRVPAMIRTLSVTNTSGDPVELTRAAPDVLPLDPARYRPPGDARETAFNARINGKPVHYGMVRSESDTLLLGASRETHFALFNPNPSYCAPVWEGNVLIPPGKTWQAPDVSLLWVFGGEGADTMGAVANLHSAWESRNAASAVFHPSRN